MGEDLIERGTASPERPGIGGGSNGGLLVGATFTQEPDLCGAVVSAVPLLDIGTDRPVLFTTITRNDPCTTTLSQSGGVSIFFHFYLIDRRTRLTLDPTDPAYTEKAARYPDPALDPQGYFSPEPMAVPGMGVHWLDPASPELNGEVFSRTFLFGSWDKDVIFSEPMITKAYLETKPDMTLPLPRAERALASGPLPVGYTIRWDADAREYQVGIHVPPGTASPQAALR